VDKRNDRLPSRISLNTERAKHRLADAGILRTHQLRPRHWRLLRAFAGQEPEPFTVGETADAQRSARLQLNTDQVPAYVLRELAQLGLIRRHAERDPKAPRRVLWHVWLISPHMLQAVREAVDILAEENADNIFFTESPSAHARRLEQTQRETNLLRLELLDLLAASSGDYAGKVIELMDRLYVEAAPHWYGTALMPVGRST
jgi:hypothetical protein